MTRLQLILVCMLSAAMATSASAQSPNGYGMPPGMPPGMMPGGGPMSMPPGMMPGMMPGGGAPPGMIPQGGGAPLSPDAMMYQGTYPPAAQYRGQIPAPPNVKLPPGVKAENGLLYYNGKAYGDVNYQNMPFNPYQNAPNPYAGGYYPNQQVAYQQAAGQMQGAPSVMGPGGQMGMPQGGPPGGMMPGYGPGPQSNCDGNCNGNCNGNCDGDAGCSDCQGGYCHRCFLWDCCRGYAGKLGYNWTAGVDALAMNRTTGLSRTLVQNNSVTPLATVFTGEQFDFDYEPGVRAFIGLTGPSGIQWQGVYMWINDFHSNGTVFGNSDLQIPNPLGSDIIGALAAADQVFLNYTSRIQSAEANAIIPWGNFQFLAGYRWMQIQETSVIQGTLGDPPTETGTFTATSSNQMNGGQVGILGEWEMCGLFNFDFFAKTGLFDNFSHEHQVLFDTDPSIGNNGLFRDTRGQFADIAYISELSAQLTMPLGSCWSIESGYRVLFINRVALAPNQYDFGTGVSGQGTHVDNGSNLILHGAHLGLTAKW